jgi:signal transduction histidine kinase
MAERASGNGAGSDQHAQRLSALGARIARVAHELNAPVSLIAGSLATVGAQFDALSHYAEATRPIAARDSTVAKIRDDVHLDYAVANARTLLSICEEGVDRVRHVIEQLRIYTRRNGDIVRYEPIDLAAELDRAARTAGCVERPAAPEFVWDLARLPTITGDAHTLGQALVNVLINAIDAASATAQPRVAVSARPLIGGESVEIRIRDNGPGISAAQRGMIFEPFFTTKTAGTGLGLAIARDAIEQHGGTIAVAADDEPGAEFVITLPVAAEAEARAL